MHTMANHRAHPVTDSHFGEGVVVLDISLAAVNIMDWTPEFAVHIAEIDLEHQLLFSTVNRLHAAMLAGQSPEMLEALVAELTEYTIVHLVNEEKVMADAHYPELQAHIEEHEDLRRRIGEVGERFRRGETALAIDLMLFLSGWLKNHVMVTDRRFGDYIQAEQTFTPYLELLMHGDLRGCRLLVQRLLAEGISFRNVYVNLFQRALYRMGELWEKKEICMGTEHLATTITLNLMTLAHPTLFDSPRNGKKVVVTCVGAELHQVGAQMISDTFEFLGWNSFFLGGNMPVEGLLELLADKRPDVLCLSVSLSSHLEEFKETVRKAGARFPELEILAGGQAFRENAGRVKDAPRLHYLKSLEELDAWVANR